MGETEDKESGLRAVQIYWLRERKNWGTKTKKKWQKERTGNSKVRIKNTLLAREMKSDRRRRRRCGGRIKVQKKKTFSFFIFWNTIISRRRKNWLDSWLICDQVCFKFVWSPSTSCPRLKSTLARIQISCPRFKSPFFSFVESPDQIWNHSLAC